MYAVLFWQLFIMMVGAAVAAGSEMRYESTTGCSKNCETCNSTTDTCTQCAPGLAYNYASNQCETAANSVANCLYYAGKGRCATCNEGFTLFGGGCETCIEHCQTCDSNPAKCDRCKEGWASPDATSKSCLTPCKLGNCHQCADGSTTACKVCKTGYRLTASLTCEKCAVANCSSCSADINKCDFATAANACLPGYFYLNDTCAACEVGCRLCDNDGQCLACNTTAGYYMWRDMLCFRSLLMIIPIGLIMLLLALTI